MQPPQESPPVNPESQQSPTSENNPPPLEDAPVHSGNPWPGAGKMSSNLFEIRMYWPILPSTKTTTNITTILKPPTVKKEPQDPNQSNPSSTVTKPERCGWGPNCPICKNAEEDWDGEHQKQLQQPYAQQKYPSKGQDTRQVQVHNPQCIKNYQVPQSQHTHTSFNVPDQYAEQIHLRNEWEKKMEQLNDKYRFDCSSGLELDSESD